MEGRSWGVLNITQCDFASRLHHAIITIQYISDSHYMALYCWGKHNVLSSQKNSPSLWAKRWRAPCKTAYSKQSLILLPAIMAYNLSHPSHLWQFPLLKSSPNINTEKASLMTWRIVVIGPLFRRTPLEMRNWTMSLWHAHAAQAMCCNYFYIFCWTKAGYCRIMMTSEAYSHVSQEYSP